MKYFVDRIIWFVGFIQGGSKDNSEVYLPSNVGPKRSAPLMSSVPFPVEFYREAIL